MTGQQTPDRHTITTTYHHGKLIRQVEMVQNSGGVNVTEVRCTCPFPRVACSLHGKVPS